MKISGKWIEIENTTLSEVTQAHKDKYHMFSFISES